MPKHAYLIMAHNNFNLLHKLIVLLDDERNDLFVHIDASVKDVDMNTIAAQSRKARLSFVTRRRVRWGGYSQIICELSLLEEAAGRGPYAYYHLISGVDLPLKPQDEIHRFFEQNNGFEFVSVEDFSYRSSERIRFYYPFQDVMGHRGRSLLGALLYYPQKMLVGLQKLCRVDRLRGMDIQPVKGSQWFSITHQFAVYVLSRRQWLEKTFRNTFCSDECFMQTVLYNSSFRDKIYPKNHGLPSNMRKIDWKRGYPYIWKIGDYEELTASGCLFARKFDPATDAEIIDRICSFVMNCKERI